MCVCCVREDTTRKTEWSDFLFSTKANTENRSRKQLFRRSQEKTETKKTAAVKSERYTYQGRLFGNNNSGSKGIMEEQQQQQQQQEQQQITTVRSKTTTKKKKIGDVVVDSCDANYHVEESHHLLRNDGDDYEQDQIFETLEYDVTNCFTMLFCGRTTLYLEEDTVSIQDNCMCNNSSSEVRCCNCVCVCVCVCVFHRWGSLVGGSLSLYVYFLFLLLLCRKRN